MAVQTNSASLQAEIDKLDGVALINIDIVNWAGQVSLSASDLQLGEGGRLPPEKAAQLGNKKICDPHKLNVFKAVKERMRRHVLDHGISVMNGYAVPIDRLPKIIPVLDDLVQKYHVAKHEFLASYDQAIADWIDENPDFAEEIRRDVKPVSEVAGRLRAAYQVIKLAPVAGAEDALKGTATGMSHELIKNVREEAGKFYKKFCKDGANSVDARTRSTWDALKLKVSGLTFLDSKFDRLDQMLDEMLALYTNGRVEGQGFLTLKHNALLLSMDDESYLYLEGADTANADAVQTDLPVVTTPSSEAAFADEPDDGDPLDALEANNPTATPDVEVPAATDSATETLDDDLDSLFGDLASMLDDQPADADAPAPSQEAVVENADASTPSVSSPAMPAPALATDKMMDWGAW
nr:DUF3150 domain-containing protein [uncultured Halomonas sp.]